jgi:transcriptional regulator of acetoin/glycerol metabolism
MCYERARLKTHADTRPLTGEGAEGPADVLQPQLFLLFERSRPLAGGARHSLANIERVTLGRGGLRQTRRFVDAGVNTLALTVPDERMSSSHARLDRRGGRWTLTDCGSTNGSRVQRKGVMRAELSDGDVLELGQTLFRFRAEVPTPPQALGDVDAADLGGILAMLGTLQPQLARDLEAVRRVSRADIPILLLGETGTGKEVLARAIHAESGRGGAFVAVNCGALSPALVESLLFGHRKGAFSGASSDEIGLVRAADGGTLFLDEIGELPPLAQAALLRVIQEREVVPVGATRAIATDLRVVAATHRPLVELTRSGDFRADLFARLSAFICRVPPLRDCVDDIGVLLAALLRRVCGSASPGVSLSAPAALSLVEHSWPLNVRELEQHLRVGVVMAKGNRFEREVASPLETVLDDAANAPAAVARPLSSEEQALQAQLIERLSEHKGNVTRVGESMGKARTQVQRWVKRLGLDPKKYR